MSSENINAPLRASCDRCRVQKLRCVPSSDGQATAPCQRCMRLKTPDNCAFSQRAKIGRSKKNGPSSRQKGDSIEKRSDSSRKAKEDMIASLPGMNAYALPGATMPAGRRKGKNKQPVHENFFQFDEDSSFLDSWISDNTISPFEGQQQDSSLLMDHEMGSTDGYFGSDVSMGVDLMQDLITTIPEFLDNDSDTEKHISEIPRLRSSLSTLLADLSEYENQLNRMSATDADNFPVGDALSLSRQFHVLLLQHSQAGLDGSDQHLQHLDVSTALITTSVYLSLLHVYWIVFDQLGTHLSGMREGHSKHAQYAVHSSTDLDMEQYRGLSLSQLTPLCVCWGWKPISKVTSMLVNLLSGIEGVLRLPADVKVLPQQSAAPIAVMYFASDEPALDLTPQAGLSSALSHVHLNKTMGEEARKLRDKISDVRTILKELDDPL